MIVLIDNYDSFSYNVYQLIGSVEPDIKVVRNDEYTVKEIEAMRPEALILSLIHIYNHIFFLISLVFFVCKVKAPKEKE